MRRKLGWLLLYLVLLLAVLLFLVKLKLPEVIDYQVMKNLHSYGLESFESGEPFLGLKGAGTKNIKLKGRYQQIDYEVSLTNVQAGFELKALLDGQIRNLSVDEITADIVFEANQEQPATTPVDLALQEQPATTPVDLALWLLTLNELNLPIETLAVNELQLNINHPLGSYQLVAQKIVAINANQSVTATLKVIAEQPFIDDMNEVNIALEHGQLAWLPNVLISANDENTLVKAQVNLRQTNDVESAYSVDFSGNISINKVNQLLTKFGVILPESIAGKPVPDMNANVSFNSDISLPNSFDLQNQQWLQDAAIEATIDVELGINRPQSTVLPIKTSSTIKMPKGSKKWQGSGVVRALELKTELTWQGNFEQGQDLSFSGLAAMGDLPLIIKSAQSFGWHLPELQLANGKVNLDIAYNRAGFKGAKIAINGMGISGLYQGVAFTGASFSLPLAKTSKGYSSTEITLNAKSISAGVELKNIDIKSVLKQSASFDNTHWVLKSFGAEVFSGQIALDKSVDFDFPFSGNTFPIALSNIHLNELLALYEEQGVSGTGRISGLIPVTLSEEGVKIDKGQMINREAGKISYQFDSDLPVDNEQLAMTVRLLRNFNYDKLAVDINFEPDGQMLLSTRLSGNNPAEFDGRQINFNINLEENLYDLFKALQLTDKLTTELEKRIREQAKPH